MKKQDKDHNIILSPGDLHVHPEEERDNSSNSGGQIESDRQRYLLKKNCCLSIIKHSTGCIV